MENIVLIQPNQIVAEHNVGKQLVLIWNHIEAINLSMSQPTMFIL